MYWKLEGTTVTIADEGYSVELTFNSVASACFVYERLENREMGVTIATPSHWALCRPKADDDPIIAKDGDPY